MKLFFDLDGTIIDSKTRMFILFQNLVNQSRLSYDEYWSLKRNGSVHKQILKYYFNYSIFQIEEFEAKWMTLIETEELLDLDICFDFTYDVLEKLSSKAQLYIVTNRQSRDRTIIQLKKLGIIHFFSDIFVTEQKNDKSTIILNRIIVDKNDYMIGDTGHDILAGKKLGINTIAVTSGFMNKLNLEKYKPDIILQNISELLNIIR